jgi:predicted N-acetyltransferase YhbS
VGKVTGKNPDNASLSASEPLATKHQLDAFDCGIPALDDWLKRRARSNEAEGASRTFVVCSEQRVVGYYSLAAGSVLRSAATSKVRRNMPDPAPVVLLGRLAVDRAWQGKGLGADLLRDAVLRTLGAAESIGVRAMLVHAISDDAKTFYERHGFRPSPVEPMTLMITVDEAKRMLVVA